MIKRFVYADNAASMPVTDRALAAAVPYFSEQYANPSAVHSMGMRAASALLDARKRIAAALGADTGEIFFTSGGTESDNWALRSGAALAAADGRDHIVTTAIEHHAVLNVCRRLREEGWNVTCAAPDSEGIVSPEAIGNALTGRTGLVSVMLANNEVGTLQPIREIADICHKNGILLHTDAVQAAGHLPIDVRELGADMLSFSGHKFGALKGIGGLYVRRGIKLPPLILGGPQEYGERAGTEPLPQIVSMAEALDESLETLAEDNARLLRLRERLTDGLLSIPDSILNGSRDKRLPGNVNVSFGGIESESLLLMLDMHGVCASGGSACTSGSEEPSHVLRAMAVPEHYIKGSLRLTVGRTASDEDIDHIISAVRESVSRLRALREGKA